MCVQYNKMAFSIERQRAPEGWAAVAAAVAVVAGRERRTGWTSETWGGRDVYIFIMWGAHCSGRFAKHSHTHTPSTECCKTSTRHQPFLLHVYICTYMIPHIDRTNVYAWFMRKPPSRTLREKPKFSRCHHHHRRRCHHCRHNILDDTRRK